MHIVPYRNAEHFGKVLVMLALQGVPTRCAPTKADMPKIGYIAFDAFGGPIAYMSVRKVEGGYGQLDGIVTNPAASSEDRHIAQDRLFQTCIEAAKAKGIKGLIGYTIAKSTGERSVKHGFVQQPHTVYVLSLKA